MRVGTPKSKVVARQVEPADLSTPAAQEFAGENRSADNLINALRRIVLVKNAFFGRIGYAEPDAVNQLVERYGINIGDQLSR